MRIYNRGIITGLQRWIVGVRSAAKYTHTRTHFVRIMYKVGGTRTIQVTRTRGQTRLYIKCITKLLLHSIGISRRLRIIHPLSPPFMLLPETLTFSRYYNVNEPTTANVNWHYRSRKVGRKKGEKKKNVGIIREKAEEGNLCVFRRGWRINRYIGQYDHKY